MLFGEFVSRMRYAAAGRTLQSVIQGFPWGFNVQVGGMRYGYFVRAIDVPRCVELRTRVTNSDVRDCVEERIRKLDDGGSGAPHCYRY